MSDHVATWRPRRPRRPVVLDVATGALVVVVYVVAQLAFLQGPHPFDPSKYFRTAVNLFETHADYWTLRIGIVLPVRAALVVFSRSEAALYALPLLSGAALAASVYATGVLLFRDRVAAAAAALATVLNANYLLNSSHIFPDVVGTATFTAGFAFVVAGAVLAERERTGWAAVAVVCAGILFGWTYLVREFSPLLLPAVIGAFVLLRYPIRRVLLLFAAAVATFSLELLYGLVRYENAFIRVEKLLAASEKPIFPGKAARIEHIQAQLQSPEDTFLVLPRLLLSWETGWGSILLIVLFVGALVVLGDRRLWLFAIWFFSLWVTFALIGLGERPSGKWLLNITNIRYWYPILPPLMLGAFGGLALLLRRYAPQLRRLHAPAVAAGVLCAGVVVPGAVEYKRCHALNVWVNDPAARWDELRSWLATDEADSYRRILTDRKTSHIAPTYTRSTFGDVVWSGTIRRAAPGRLPERIRSIRESALDETIVLFHGVRVQQSARRALAELRGEWVPLFVSDDEQMVALGHASAAPPRSATAAETWWDPPVSEPARAGRCGSNPYEFGAVSD